MTQSHRLADGGIVDRSRPLAFSSTARATRATPATRSPPRCSPTACIWSAAASSITARAASVTAGADEPNALVQLARGARTEPNCARRRSELYDGLVAASQNRWPSLRFDVGALNDAFSRLLPAGFYYKTFMWPPTPRWWLRYEHAIRRAAGHGPRGERARSRSLRASVCALRRAGDRRRAGGPRRGARRAHARRARDRCATRTPRCGGSLLGGDATIDGDGCALGRRATTRELAAHADVTLLPRTTAFGYYDGNLVGWSSASPIICAEPPPHAPRQRLWKVRAQAGRARERRARARHRLREQRSARHDARRRRAHLRRALRRAPGNARGGLHQQRQRVRRRRSRCTTRASASPRSSTRGRKRRSSGALPRNARDARRADHRRRRDRRARTAGCACGAVDIAPLDGGAGAAHRLRSGLRVGRLESRRPSFFAGARQAALRRRARRRSCPTPRRCRSSPRARPTARFDLAAALADGHAAGLAAAARRASRRRRRAAPRAARDRSTGPLQPLWAWRRAASGDKRFVDLQNDVTVADIALAAREGYRSVEHLKRYTTLGMGTDQGKTGNIVGLALLAEQLGVTDPAGRHDDVPPAVHAGDAGRACRARDAARTSSRRATRRCTTGTSSTARASSTPGCGSGRTRIRAPANREDDAANREAKNVRTNVGVVDVSTLGKIELQGRDVAEFLNRVYINRWDTLAVGRCRYGVMLRDDGMVFDDGTTSRLGADALPDDDDDRQRGQGHAASRVSAAGRMAGARGLRHVGHRAVGGGGAVGPEGARRAREARRHRRVERGVSVPRGRRMPRSRGARGAIPARLFRMSYSGELAYEIHVPARPRPRDVGSGDGGRRGIRHHAVRHRGDEHAAHRKGTRRRRPRGRRPHDRRRSRHGQARQRREVVHRQAAARRGRR